MTCWHPLRAYRSKEKTSTGKHAITFNPLKALIEGSGFDLPCGRCTGCRIDKSEQVAIRCVHEAQLYGTRNSFITLTYDQQHVPRDYSVKLRDFQLFMKKLRKSLPQKIRFLACGEYGEKNNRPHYHALIFNHDFPDKKFFIRRRDNDYFKSKSLDQIWSNGSTEIGHLTFASAAYTARYVMKKIVGDAADDHYYRRSPIDGQFYRVETEFCVGSNGGRSGERGLGFRWFERYKSDVFPSDYLVVNQGGSMRRHKPPRYYTQLLEEDEQQKIKSARKRQSRLHAEDNTPARLRVREEVQQHRINRLKREL